MEIYSWDYTKLKRKDEIGYRKDQEQAKIYHNNLPKNKNYEVKIDNPKIVNEIFNIADIHNANTDFCYILIDKNETTKNKPFAHMSITYICENNKIRSCDIANMTTKDYTNACKIFDILQKYIKYGEEKN